LKVESQKVKSKKGKESNKWRSGARQFGDGGKEFARVDILGPAEDFVGEADFDELAGAHDGDARGNLRDNREVVGIKM
jgi:hypothetical protein